MSINFADGLEDVPVVTSSSVLPEDAGEGSLRPRTLTEYIGQEKAKDNLGVFIDAARLWYLYWLLRSISGPCPLRVT